MLVLSFINAIPFISNFVIQLSISILGMHLYVGELVRDECLQTAFRRFLKSFLFLPHICTQNSKSIFSVFSSFFGTFPLYFCCIYSLEWSIIYVYLSQEERLFFVGPMCHCIAFHSIRIQCLSIDLF